MRRIDGDLLNGSEGSTEPAAAKVGSNETSPWHGNAGQITNDEKRRIIQ
jgi:hypothetical protein